MDGFNYSFDSPKNEKENSKSMTKHLAFLLAFAFLVLPWEASSHRSGCHRWHSCPSDRGTYSMNTGQACKIATYKGATLRLLVWKGLFNPFKIVEPGRKVHRAKRKAQGASKKKPLLNRPGQFLLKIFLWPSLTDRISSRLFIQRQAGALKKLLIEKGLITEAEFMQKLSAERVGYQEMLQNLRI